ncbi:unnamed protein product, partial [Iphiclides podalirius]
MGVLRASPQSHMTCEAPFLVGKSIIVRKAVTRRMDASVAPSPSGVVLLSIPLSSLFLNHQSLYCMLLRSTPFLLTSSPTRLLAD